MFQVELWIVNDNVDSTAWSVKWISMILPLKELFEGTLVRWCPVPCDSHLRASQWKNALFFGFFIFHILEHGLWLDSKLKKLPLNLKHSIIIKCVYQDWDYVHLVAICYLSVFQNYPNWRTGGKKCLATLKQDLVIMYIQLDEYYGRKFNVPKL